MQLNCYNFAAIQQVAFLTTEKSVADLSRRTHHFIHVKRTWLKLASNSSTMKSGAARLNRYCCAIKLRQTKPAKDLVVTSSSFFQNSYCYLFAKFQRFVSV